MRRKVYPNYRTITVDKNGGLSIHVDHVSNWIFHACALAIVAVVAGTFSWEIVAAMPRVPSRIALVLLLVLTFILLWFAIGVWTAVERLCKVEVAVRKGFFCWSYHILRWRRDFEIPQQDVLSVTAIHKIMGSALEIAVPGTTFRLGELLDDDLETITRELRRALPLQDAK